MVNLSGAAPSPPIEEKWPLRTLPPYENRGKQSAGSWETPVTGGFTRTMPSPRTPSGEKAKVPTGPPAPGFAAQGGVDRPRLPGPEPMAARGGSRGRSANGRKFGLKKMAGDVVLPKRKMCRKKRRNLGGFGTSEIPLKPENSMGSRNAAQNAGDRL